MMMNNPVATTILRTMIACGVLAIGVLFLGKYFFDQRTNRYENRKAEARNYAEACAESISKFFQQFKTVPQKSCSSFQNQFAVESNQAYPNNSEIFCKSKQNFQIRVTDKNNDSYLLSQSFTVTSFKAQ
jgi:hypothetical protein